MAFKHGTNISHWLSQSPRRGAERRAFFDCGDVRRIADWGFDHIRLPVDEEQLWDDRGLPQAEALDLLDAALDWSEEAGLRVIVDLHILRSHYFNSKVEPELFTDPESGKHFADLWSQLSDRLHSRSCERVAMETDLAQPLEVAARTGCSLYCGEFGVYQRAPWAVRAAWYRDFVSLLNEKNIGWANWDYKGGFGLLDAGKSTGVAEVLLGGA